MEMFEKIYMKLENELLEEDLLFPVSGPSGSNVHFGGVSSSKDCKWCNTCLLEMK